eukprot:8966783-Lingulodinium_polyedra.AAC.1
MLEAAVPNVQEREYSAFPATAPDMAGVSSEWVTNVHTTDDGDIVNLGLRGDSALYHAGCGAPLRAQHPDRPRP